MKNNGVSIRCVKEYSKAETPFRLIACRVNKKDHEAFCDAIKQVRTAALLLGYDEYDSVCSMMRSCENNYK